MHKLARILFAAVLLAASLSGIAFAHPARAAAGTEQPNAPTQTWVTLMSEGFEGTWPGSGWMVRGLGASPQYWGKVTYQKHAGSYSVWPAAAGPGAITPGALVVYPDYLDSEMVYGPIDLSAAKFAELHFWFWAEIEVGWDDYLLVSTSGDGTNFIDEQQWDGSLDWNEIVVDLTKYAGDSSVWVRWYFHSDESVGMAGPFIDDVSILVDAGLETPAVSIKRSGASDIRLDWLVDPDATSFEVWRGTNAPFFTPGTDCTGAPSSCSVVTTNYYIHGGGSGSTTNNYTYVVRAVKGNVKSALSNRTAEFDFALTKGN